MNNLLKYFIKIQFSKIKDGTNYLVYLKEGIYRISNAKMYFGRLILMDDSNYGEGEEILESEILELYEIKNRKS